MKKALIWAYTQVNLGDDLFIKILCERYPNTLFSIIGKKSKLIPFENIPNLQIIRDYYSSIDSGFRRLGCRSSFYNNKIKKTASNNDVVINLGGSIFMEFNDWQKNLNDYKGVIENSSKFIVLGSNFGPYKSDDFLLNYSEVFNRLDDICFRDKKSYGLFKDSTNVRYAPDIVFGLAANKVQTLDDSDEYILISVMDFSLRQKLSSYQKLYEKNIVKICSFLVSKNKKVKLMSFCKEEGDERMIDRIRKTFGESPFISSYNYRGDIEEALAVIKSANSIVATRFHSMILALVFQKPFYPIIYSEKMTNVLEDIRFKGKYSMLSEPIDCEELYDQLKTLLPSFESNCNSNQFLYLDSILLEEGKFEVK